MTATKPEPRAQTAAEQLAAEILALHRSHLSELRIVIVEAGVILRGVARCFYGKQMALREVTRLYRQPVIANEIEVTSP
jgi:hypothetical protein